MIGCVAFVEFVVRVESWLVCAVLLGAGCLGYLAYAVQKREWIGAVLSVVVGGVGVSLCLKLPPQYIWSQELSLILLAWLAFIGASMATRADKHIQVDAFARIIPRGLRPWSRALGLLVTTVFCVYITLLAYEHVFGPRGDYISGETRPATGIPGWTIIFAVVVAFGLMSLRFGARTVDAFLHPRVPDREVSH
ncbi:MAG: TRAP transporter small permease [Myxococcales bacterium]|nr:TRAP transporter small permease [Myxococcales bacterium]